MSSQLIEGTGAELLTPTSRSTAHHSDLLYIKVAAVLVVLTAIEIYATYADYLGHFFLPLLLVLMAIKFLTGRAVLHAPQVRQQDLQPAVLGRGLPRHRRVRRRAGDVPVLRQGLTAGGAGARHRGVADLWRFQAHPEVWLLVAVLGALYIYAIQVIGPRAVPAGQPVVTPHAGRLLRGRAAILWVASDWPIHDIGEDYLYSVHMLQHMMLSYFMPPLVLLATPTWLARLLVGKGRTWTAFKWLTKPVVAGVIFNVVVMVIHIPRS